MSLARKTCKKAAVSVTYFPPSASGLLDFLGLPKYTKRLQIESDCDDGSGEVELVELRGGGVDDEAAGFLGYYDAAADRVGGEELDRGNWNIEVQNMELVLLQ
jgi:hypothetical protein